MPETMKEGLVNMCECEQEGVEIAADAFVFWRGQSVLFQHVPRAIELFACEKNVPSAQRIEVLCRVAHSAWWNNDAELFNTAYATLFRFYRKTPGILRRAHSCIPWKVIISDVSPLPFMAHYAMNCPGLNPRAFILARDPMQRAFALRDAADYAVRTTNMAPLVVLLQHVPLWCSDVKGQTLVHHCAAQGYADLLKRLKPEQCEVNRQDLRGFTPLSLASCGKHTEAMVCLLDMPECPITDESPPTE